MNGHNMPSNSEMICFKLIFPKINYLKKRSHSIHPCIQLPESYEEHSRTLILYIMSHKKKPKFYINTIGESDLRCDSHH